MAYQEALEAAGAVVEAFEEFGSYQGDWWALVTLPDGRRGWINGSYGSCPGCDAYEAEFGYHEEACETHAYQHGPHVDACTACQAAKVAHREKLARFGAGYLDDLLSQTQAEAVAVKHIEWDSDAPKMRDFIVSHRQGAGSGDGPRA